jgi:hypothetical protein
MAGKGRHGDQGDANRPAGAQAGQAEMRSLGAGTGGPLTGGASATRGKAMGRGVRFTKWTMFAISAMTAFIIAAAARCWVP